MSEPVATAPRARMTLTDYAKRRGVSKMAVSNAVKGGRLSASVERDPDGRPWIIDPEQADREWTANTDLTRAPSYVKQREADRATAPRPAAAAPEAPTEPASADAGTVPPWVADPLLGCMNQAELGAALVELRERLKRSPGLAEQDVEDVEAVFGLALSTWCPTVTASAVQA